MPLVPLPSGAIAPLETPGLLPLLSGGGTTLALARATFAHGEMDAADLSPEDLYAVALWGILALCDSPAAVTLASVCEAFSEPPARRIGISDPTLAWTLDSGCLSALNLARAGGSEEDDEPEPGDPHHRRLSVHDDWSPDGD